jgi:hypothetical protein
MQGFFRMYSAQHVRIRYAEAPPATAPISTWRGEGGIYPVRYNLFTDQNQQTVKLALIGQTLPPLSTITLPADPGPYALVRDGVSERVLDQPVITLPTTTYVTVPQGQVVQVDTDRNRVPAKIGGKRGVMASARKMAPQQASTNQKKGNVVAPDKGQAMPVRVSTTARTGSTAKPNLAETEVQSGTRRGARVVGPKPRNALTVPTKKS